MHETFKAGLGRGLGVAVIAGVVTSVSVPAVPTTVQLTANALVMGGTTFPTPSPGYVQAAIDDFIVPTLGGSYTGVGVTTPEGIIGIDESVSDGVADLTQAMAAQEAANPGQPYVVFGYSQSGVITTNVKRSLAAQKAAGQPIPDVTFVSIGNGNRPNGGIAARLPGLVIPFVDFTFNGAAPTDTGIRSIDIARQYDGLADTPQFILNPFALLNAVIGIVSVHLGYSSVSLDPTDPKYVPGTIEETRGDTTYYWIPNKNLPLLDPFRLLGVPEGILDIVEPALKVLVEAGYDRSIPFGEPTPAQLIPVIDPVTLGVQLLGAGWEGANNAAELVGGALPGYTETAGNIAQLEASTASTIGSPYREIVTAINKFNPILLFNKIEGPIVSAIDGVLNATGIPRLINRAIMSVITPLTSWIERNVLYPQQKPTPTSAARSLPDSALASAEALTDTKRTIPESRRASALVKGVHSAVSSLGNAGGGQDVGSESRHSHQMVSAPPGDTLTREDDDGAPASLTDKRDATTPSPVVTSNIDRSNGDVKDRSTSGPRDRISGALRDRFVNRHRQNVVRGGRSSTNSVTDAGQEPTPSAVSTPRPGKADSKAATPGGRSSAGDGKSPARQKRSAAKSRS